MTASARSQISFEPSSLLTHSFHRNLFPKVCSAQFRRGTTRSSTRAEITLVLRCAPIRSAGNNAANDNASVRAATSIIYRKCARYRIKYFKANPVRTARETTPLGTGSITIATEVYVTYMPRLHDLFASVHLRGRGVEGFVRKHDGVFHDREGEEKGVAGERISLCGIKF